MSVYIQVDRTYTHSITLAVDEFKIPRLSRLVGRPTSKSFKKIFFKLKN